MTNHSAPDTERRSVWPVEHLYTATVSSYEEVEFPRVFGVYSTEKRANEARERARLQPGFDGRLGLVDSQEELTVYRYDLDDAAWRGGFFSYDAEGREE
jgi:hypothetical protein